MKRIVLFCLLVVAMAIVGCTAEPGEPEVVETTRLVEVPVTRLVESEVEIPVTVEVEVTRLVEATRIVTATPEPAGSGPEEATEPAAAMESVFLELDGVGDAITDNFQLGDCYKAVFTTTQDGGSNFSAWLHNIERERRYLVANRYGPGDDIVHEEIEAGTYFLVVEADEDSAWSLVGECR